MFELGWIEIGIVGVIALVVLGPERLPKAARFVGLWVRKARAQWYAVKSELDREMAAEELKASIEAERGAIRDAVREIDDEARQVREAFVDAPAATDPPVSAVAPASAVALAPVERRADAADGADRPPAA